MEVKVVDTAISLACDQTGAVLLLNSIARGSDYNQRVGRILTMVGMELRFRDYVTGTTGTDQFHRIVVVYDRQPNAAACSWNDVFGGVGCFLPMNINNRARFVVLHDEVNYLNSAGEAGSAKYCEIVKRLEHSTVFNAGSVPSIADITTGSVYMLTCGLNVAGATAGTVQGTARIYYVDQ